MLIRSLLRKNIFPVSLSSLSPISFHRQPLYSTASVTDNILRVTLTSPHNSFYKSVHVKQVNVESTTGSMGILAAHVPTIQQLVPGIIEIIPEESDKLPSKFFTSGGFAVMNPDSSLVISASEVWPLSAFSSEVVEQLKTRTIDQLSQVTTEIDKTTANIALDVLNRLSQALLQASSK